MNEDGIESAEMYFGVGVPLIDLQLNPTHFDFILDNAFANHGAFQVAKSIDKDEHNLRLTGSMLVSLALTV